MTNLWENFYLCITKAFTLHFPRKTERSVLSSFIKKKKKKCYMITQDGNKAGEEKCLFRTKTADGDSRQCRQRQLKECQNTRWKTISKSHRTPSDGVKWDLALYLRRSGKLLGLVFIWRCPSVGSQFSVGENSRKNVDWTMIVSSQRFGVWTAVLEMDYNSSPKVENKDKKLNWLARCFNTSFELMISCNLAGKIRKRSFRLPARAP